MVESCLVLQSGKGVLSNLLQSYFYYITLELLNSMVFLDSDRIIRAFLVEEQKIVKKVLKLQKAKEKVAPKA